MWYAVFVMSGKEEFVKTEIDILIKRYNKKLTYNLLIAKREIEERKKGTTQKVVKKIFPGYIFLETDDIVLFYQLTKNCDRLIKILKQEDFFSEIKYEEILNIICMVDSCGIIGVSDIIIKNDHIQVINGPLKNYNGVIKKINRRKRRITVLFTFGDKTHPVDLSFNVLNLNDISNDIHQIPFISCKNSKGDR